MRGMRGMRGKRREGQERRKREAGRLWGRACRGPPGRGRASSRLGGPRGRESTEIELLFTEQKQLLAKI